MAPSRPALISLNKQISLRQRRKKMFIDPTHVYFWDRLIFKMICYLNRRKKTHALPSLCAQSPQHNAFMRSIHFNCYRFKKWRFRKSGHRKRQTITSVKIAKRRSIYPICWMLVMPCTTMEVQCFDSKKLFYFYFNHNRESGVEMTAQEAVASI